MKSLLALLLMTSVAHAEPVCGPAQNVYDVLEGQYGEQRVQMGVEMSGELLEWWINPETGSFSLVITGVDGTSCLIAGGYDGQTFALRPDL